MNWVSVSGNMFLYVEYLGGNRLTVYKETPTKCFDLRGVKLISCKMFSFSLNLNCFKCFDFRGLKLILCEQMVSFIIHINSFEYSNLRGIFSG